MCLIALHFVRVRSVRSYVVTYATYFLLLLTATVTATAGRHTWHFGSYVAHSAIQYVSYGIDAFLRQLEDLKMALRLDNNQGLRDLGKPLRNLVSEWLASKSAIPYLVQRFAPTNKIATHS